MGFSLGTTPGGNTYLQGSGTFPQLVDGGQAIAMSRDNQDAALLDAAKTGDATTLTAAKDHADQGDNSVLTRAKEHADQGDVTTLTAAKDHADQGDSETLSSARDYADAQDEALKVEMGWHPLDPSTGYVAAFVDANGKLSEFALTTGGVVPGWVVTRWAERMGMVQMGSEGGYSFAVTDENGKVGELCLDENGQIPDWVLRRLAARMGGMTDRGQALVHAARVSEFTHAMGVVDTGGLGAVALRFDHGLANFDTVIRPLLEARNLPYCLALNSRAWGASENAGVTQTMVNSWVAGGLCEIWNHGADHVDHSTEDDLTDVIVQGKAELESQLPAAKIWGWIVPGVGGTNYDGFNGGTTPEAFGTVAGRLILEHHAVSSGAFTGSHQRILDGQVRQGMGHYGLDSQTSVSAVNNHLNIAQTDRTGLQLMMHPSVIGAAGKISVETFTAVLDSIVARRDAGNIKVLSPYQLTVANAQIGA